MAKKKMLINNWPNNIGKTSNHNAFDYAWRFADILKLAVGRSVRQIAVQVSSSDSSAFGISATVPRTGASASSVFAQGFRDGMDLNSTLGGNKHGHSNAYARHFAATTGRTTHMDYGNLVEQAAYKMVREWEDGTNELDAYKGKWIYNDPNSYSGLFDVSYKGSTKSARPDFRLSLIDFAQGGFICEAIYDVTSEGAIGHLIEKKVNTKTLDMIPGILSGYEIAYSNNDLL